MIWIQNQSGSNQRAGWPERASTACWARMGRVTSTVSRRRARLGRRRVGRQASGQVEPGRIARHHENWRRPTRSGFHVGHFVHRLFPVWTRAHTHHRKNGMGHARDHAPPPRFIPLSNRRSSACHDIDDRSRLAAQELLAVGSCQYWIQPLPPADPTDAIYAQPLSRAEGAALCGTT